MLDNPPAFPVEPGPDMRGASLDEHVDAILATIGADRQVTPDEMRSVQRLMAGIQAIAAQQAAMQQGAQEEGISDATEPFGATEGTEALPGGPTEGAAYMQG